MGARRLPRSAFALLAGLATIAVGCAAGELHPCEKGGQPAWDRPVAGSASGPNAGGSILTSSDAAATERKPGTRQCEQVKDPQTGMYFNQGRYREWFPNGQLALEGEYKHGMKTGKWIEWDAQGKKLAERWYTDGKEEPTRSARSDAPLGAQPAPVPGSK